MELGALLLMTIDRRYSPTAAAAAAAAALDKDDVWMRQIVMTVGVGVFL